MGKFTDDILTGPANEPRPHIFIATLFTELGVGDAPAQDQAKALATWLRTNTPSEGLTFSINNHGFGYLLDEAKGLA